MQAQLQKFFEFECEISSFLQTRMLSILTDQNAKISSTVGQNA